MLAWIPRPAGRRPHAGNIASLAVHALTVTFLIPDFGVFWGVLLLNEPLTLSTLLGFAYHSRRHRLRHRYPLPRQEARPT